MRTKYDHRCLDPPLLVEDDFRRRRRLGWSRPPLVPDGRHGPTAVRAHGRVLLYQRGRARELPGVEQVHVAWIRRRRRRRQRHRGSASPCGRAHRRQRSASVGPAGPTPRAVVSSLERAALHAVRLHAQPGGPVHDVGPWDSRGPLSEARKQPQRGADPALRRHGAALCHRARFSRRIAAGPCACSSW